MKSLARRDGGWRAFNMPATRAMRAYREANAVRLRSGFPPWHCLVSAASSLCRGFRSPVHSRAAVPTSLSGALSEAPTMIVVAVVLAVDTVWRYAWVIPPCGATESRDGMATGDNQRLSQLRRIPSGIWSQKMKKEQTQSTGSNRHSLRSQGAESQKNLARAEFRRAIQRVSSRGKARRFAQRPRREVFCFEPDGKS